MKCKDCTACRLGFFKSYPESYACLGTRNPFVIQNLNNVCCLYDEEERDWIKMNMKEHKHVIPDNIIPYITVEFLHCLRSKLYEEFGYGNRDAILSELGTARWYECFQKACTINDSDINSNIILHYHNSLIWHEADDFEFLLCSMMGEIV